MARKKKNYLVVDIEATCCNKGTVTKDDVETIEIGAVLIDGHEFFQTSSYDSFIRPFVKPELTDFCKSLTTIQQRDVDTARLFPEVFAEFMAWAGDPESLIFCSWGEFDWRQIGADCIRCGIPNILPEEKCNLKNEFSAKLGISRRFGMAKALDRCGLRLNGTHHRGIDDAINISRMIPYIFGDVPVRR
jgi:inhibitor of KinA sporulation pathway (predicted exonuclease)